MHRSHKRIDERTLLRQQLHAAARTMLRPAAYAGTARELALSAFHVATYPVGLLRAGAHLEPAAPPNPDILHPGLRREPGLARVPVVLIHGYVHNRSAFLVMSRRLRRAGFQVVHGLNFNPLRHDIPTLAQRLATEVDRARHAADSEQVMLVGHSMGGLVARLYAQELAPPGVVDTVVTLATPHRGTYTSLLGLGPAARDMRPGSRLIRRLQESARPSSTRWLAYYSDLDMLVTPAVNAKLVHPALNATNIRLRDTGHLALLMSREAVAGVVDHLADRRLGRPEDDEPPQLRVASRRPGRRRLQLVASTESRASSA